MKKSLITLALLGMSLASGVASAADDGVYAFGQLGQQTLSRSVQYMDSGATQYQFGMGLPVSDTVAFEASWLQASHHTAESGLTVDYSGAIVGVRTFFPVNEALTVTGKVGMTLLSVDVGGVTSDGSNFMAGVGVEYKLTPKTALTVNYDFMDKPADTTRNLSALSVGMKFKF